MIARHEHELEKHLILEIFVLLKGFIQLLFNWEWVCVGCWVWILISCKMEKKEKVALNIIHRANG